MKTKVPHATTAADARPGRRRMQINRTLTMGFFFSSFFTSLLALLAFVAFTSAIEDASPPASSELDAKSIDMARRIIQKIKDYSKTDNDYFDQKQQQPQSSSSSPSWKMLLSTLEKSFLGIDASVGKEEISDSDSNSRNNYYSSTPQEESARIQAVHWLALDYEKSISSSSSARHHHEHESGLLDRYALATIYYATNGKDWTYNDSTSFSSKEEEQEQHHFLSSSSHLQWIGVNGNNRDGHVTMLDLSNRNLVSPSFLPLELVLLSPTLELLWLSDNMSLSGTIPNYIFGSDFASLSSLSICHTSMTGPIPDTLYTLPKLSSLRLYKSNFSGSISANIGRLTGLRWLWLHENRFSGVLPEELGSLSKLEGMTLHGNQFEVIHDGDSELKTNIIPESVCANLMTTTTTSSNVGGGSSGGGELKHLWTDCEEDALLLVEEEEEREESSKLNSSTASSVKACSCCTRCFPRKKNENERISSSFVADDEIKSSIN